MFITIIQADVNNNRSSQLLQFNRLQWDSPVARVGHPLHLLVTAPLRFYYKKQCKTKEMNYFQRLFKYDKPPHEGDHLWLEQRSLNATQLNCVDTRGKTASCLPEVPDVETAVCSTGCQDGLIMRWPLNLEKQITHIRCWYFGFMITFWHI